MSIFYNIQLHNGTTLQISKQIQIFFGCIPYNLLLSQTTAQFFFVKFLLTIISFQIDEILNNYKIKQNKLDLYSKSNKLN